MVSTICGGICYIITTRIISIIPIILFYRYFLGQKLVIEFELFCRTNYTSASVFEDNTTGIIFDYYKYYIIPNTSMQLFLEIRLQ